MMSSLECAILDVLNGAVMPTKGAVLGRLVKPLVGKAVKKEVLAATLAGLVEGGQVHAIPMSGKAGDVCYSTMGLEAVAGQILRVKVHAAAKPMKRSDLRKKLPAALQSFCEAATEALISRGEIFILPRSVPMVLKQAPRPSDLLDAAKLKALGTLLRQASELRSTPVTMEDFLAWLDGEEMGAPPAMEAAPVALAEVLVPTEERLREWYGEDRRRSSSQMIPIVQTWRRYADWAVKEGGRPDLEVFKSALQNLYNDCKVLLEPCERPQDLPEEERSLLVPLAIGPPGFAWSWMSSN